MKGFIIKISWTFRGDSGHEVLGDAYTNIDDARVAFQKTLKSEQEDTWLNDVLDSNLRPRPDWLLDEYEISEDYFVVDSEECGGRTEIWIDEVYIV